MILFQHFWVLNLTVLSEPAHLLCVLVYKFVSILYNAGRSQTGPEASSNDNAQRLCNFVTSIVSHHIKRLRIGLVVKQITTGSSSRKFGIRTSNLTQINPTFLQTNDYVKASPPHPLYNYALPFKTGSASDYLDLRVNQC